MAKKHKSNARYAENKAAKVGTELICPICGKTFTKKQWAQAFCCNECKNTFWNRKGDRHRTGYYEEYDLQHPSRLRNRILYGSTNVVCVKGDLTPAEQREVAGHRIRINSVLNRYTDSELKEMYENLKYGSHRHLDEQTEYLSDTLETCHPFDLDGQFADAEF